MVTTSRSEIGASVIANGITTNYLEAGSDDETVVLIHGSGRGVTSYANWRLVIPALAESFRVVAPDMVGFGYSDRVHKIVLMGWVEAMCTPENEIRKLPHRTLIIHGREDQVIPVQTSLRLFEIIDNADLSVYSHCGHWSMIERTSDFNRSLTQFFSN